jgi:hypothetical protein
VLFLSATLTAAAIKGVKVALSKIARKVVLGTRRHRECERERESIEEARRGGKNNNFMLRKGYSLEIAAVKGGRRRIFILCVQMLPLSAVYVHRKKDMHVCVCAREREHTA